MLSRASSVKEEVAPVFSPFGAREGKVFPAHIHFPTPNYAGASCIYKEMEVDMTKKSAAASFFAAAIVLFALLGNAEGGKKTDVCMHAPVSLFPKF